MFDDFLFDDDTPITFLPDTQPAKVDAFELEAAETRKARDRENAELKAAKAAKKAARIERNRGRVESYEFSDTTISGKGWHIYFDKEEQKTRVVFEKRPAEKIRRLVKESGFYWNFQTESWNKRLNMKSYRAAKELALKLNAYTA